MIILTHENVISNEDKKYIFHFNWCSIFISFPPIKKFSERKRKGMKSIFFSSIHLLNDAKY
jgi:hypothetical protein